MVELTVHTGLHSREKERAGDCRADQCAIVAIRASVRVHIRASGDAHIRASVRAHIRLL